MPRMGVSVTEGTLAAWHKHVGDRVEPDETICEISTDKIDTDIPAPAGGRVSELLVAEGETVAVGTVLARIESDTASAPEVLIDAGEPVAVVMHAVPSAAPAAAGGDREGTGCSPVVRRIAAEHGLDLSLIVGTGRDGRVRREDVLAAVEAGAPHDPPFG
ncbi:MAG: E3 binding domain-containing protein, partial [Actinobacteria bacterium]|nr:E3 binding domain-containing protein [Actinomycetota bacterium]